MYEKWLRSFHATATHGSFTAAAHHLRVSQPTVTEQVRALEARFHVELLLRVGRGIRLSPAGEKLFLITRDMFAAHEEAVRLLEASRDLRTGTLRMGTVGPAVTMPLIEGFSRRFPHVDVTVDVGTAEQVIECLDGFANDAVIVARHLPAPRYHSRPFMRFSVMALVHATHPWSQRHTVRISDFADQRVVFREASSSTQQVIDRALEDANVRVGHVLRVAGREGVREAVLRRLGIGVMCAVDHIADSDLRLIPIEGAGVEISFFLACISRRQTRSTIQALFQIAEELTDADMTRPSCPHGPVAGGPGIQRRGDALRATRPDITEALIR